MFGLGSVFAEEFKVLGLGPHGCPRDGSVVKLECRGHRRRVCEPLLSRLTGRLADTVSGEFAVEETIPFVRQRPVELGRYWPWAAELEPCEPRVESTRRCFEIKKTPCSFRRRFCGLAIWHAGRLSSRSFFKSAVLQVGESTGSCGRSVPACDKRACDKRACVGTSERYLPGRGLGHSAVSWR